MEPGEPCVLRRLRPGEGREASPVSERLSEDLTGDLGACGNKWRGCSQFPFPGILCFRLRSK